MPIQTTYPFTHSYPRLGVTTSSVHTNQISTGLVVANSLPIQFGTAIEAGLFTANGANILPVDSKYQRLAVQRAGAGLIAGADFRGIALLENKQPEGKPPRHTVLVDTTSNSEFLPLEDIPILEKGRCWVRFDAAVVNANPRSLVINYLAGGIFTTGAGTLATSVRLLQPTVVDDSGFHCGLVFVNLP